MLKFNKSFASLMFAVLLAAVAVPAQRKATTSPWYSPYGADVHKAERGDISELKGKRRVFVSVWAFREPDSGSERVVLRQQVLNDLKKSGGLEVVSNPEEADFAVHFSAHTSFSTTDCKYYVVTRGTQSSDGAFAPRLLQSGATQVSGCSDWLSRRAASLGETLKGLQH